MLYKFLIILTYVIINNFSVNEFHDFLILGIVFLIFSYSEKQINFRNSFLFFLILILSVPINLNYKKFVIYENFNGFKMPLHETVDPNKLNTAIAVSEDKIYIFFKDKENFPFTKQSIKLNLESDILNINQEVFFDGIINLETDTEVLIHNNSKFNSYKKKIKEFKWVGVGNENIPYNKNLKNLISIENKDFKLNYLFWFDKINYKISNLENKFNHKNLYKERLPRELYEEFKNQSLKEYPDFYNGSHSPQYKDKILMIDWSYLPNYLFFPTKDLFFENDKNFSRKIYNINFESLEEHNLPFVNDYKYWNYSHLDKFIFRSTNYPNQKAKIPYFTSYKFNKNHIDSDLCWKGYLYIKLKERYKKELSEEKKCLKLNSVNIKNLIYFSSIDTSHPLEVSLSKNTKHKFSYHFVIILKLMFLISVFFIFFEKRNYERLIFYSGLIFISYIIIFFLERDFSFGFYEPLGAWDDGLVHETYSIGMIKNFINGNWIEVLRGGESLYDNSMLMRYINFIEKFIFGDTRIFHLLLAVFLPLIIFKFYRISVSFFGTFLFILIFLFKGSEKIIFPSLRSVQGSYLNTLENLGIVYYEWVHLFAWNYEEAIGFFTILIALIISNSTLKNESYSKIFLLSFFFSLSALFRLNYAPVGAIFLTFFGIRFLLQKKILNLSLLILGFSVVSLYFIHNLYFSSEISIFSVHLSRSSIAIPLINYPLALIDIMKFQFDTTAFQLVSEKLEEVFKSFNLIILFISFVFLLIIKDFKKFELFFKLVYLSSLFMFILMFYYISIERYSFLTWFLVIFCLFKYFDDFIKKNIKIEKTKLKYLISFFNKI